MYLLNLWDKDDKIKRMPQIQATSLKQGFSDTELFETPNTQHIDCF
jgi:hypothetical protein